MKHLLITTIAAVLLVGCGPQPPDISIYVAAVEGNIEAVKQHMVAGTDANSKDPKSRSGVTGLHGAAESGHVEIAELLIAEGANVNEMSKVGTPLLLAAAFGQKEILELFIAKGGDVKVIQPGDKTPLYYAAAKGHKEIADLLIAKGVNVNSKDVNGASSIHRAVDNGYKEIVELLIANGADVNAMYEYRGQTPLHLAVRNTGSFINKEIVELLIANGANVNALNKEGMSPLDVVISSPPPPWVQTNEIADILREHGGKAKKTTSALEAKILIDDYWMLAINNNNIDGVKYLLENGANVNASLSDPLAINSKTPLSIAIERDREKIADLLRKNGAMPFHVAASTGDIKAVRQHLIGGANVNMKNLNGNTPLDRAIKYKESETADLLRKHGGKTRAELKAEGK